MQSDMTETPLKSWIDRKKNITVLSDVDSTTKKKQAIAHYFDPDVLLDDTFSRVDNIPGLKTPLYGHQKTIVRAMVDLENNIEFDVHIDKKLYRVSVNAGILSEKVGSGKTFDILATILLNPKPIARPEVNSIACSKFPFPSLIYKKQFKFTLNPTLIFVGSSVIRQWANTISTYTNLRTFVVYGIREFEKLINMIEDKTVNKFDIILIKNGIISRLVFPKNVKLMSNNNVTTPHMYSLIANIKGICWPRVVIDDFDVIKLKSAFTSINATFTWYVSSTRKSMGICMSSDKTYYPNLSQLLIYGNYQIGNIFNNQILYSICNVRNSLEFVQKSNKLPTPTFWAYKFKNPNAKLVNIIGALSQEMKEVVEMINADAIETAAEHLGIKTTTTAGIFEKILGDQYQQVVFLTKIIKFINEQTETAHERMPWNKNNGMYGIKKLENFEPITLQYPGIDRFLEEQYIKYSDEKNKATIRLNRIKDHIMEGECPICISELKTECEGKVVIFKCCSVIVCEKCCFDVIFKKRHSAVCANCRTGISLKELIYINEELNLDRLISDINDGNIEQADIQSMQKKPIIKKHNYGKYDAIVDIIKGNPVPSKEKVKVNIPVLMTGPAVLPEAKNKKVLVFANFDETLRKIQEKFSEEGIQYEQLGGEAAKGETRKLCTNSYIADVVHRFQTSDKHNVLLINSIKYCAGLNLQVASDLIFSHLIIDENIEGQVAGRIMRLGRTTAVNFHYVLFDNEYDSKKASGSMWI